MTTAAEDYRKARSKKTDADAGFFAVILPLRGAMSPGQIVWTHDSTILPPKQ